VQPIRPFLKWAGAKTKLLPAIRAAAPKEARRLIEPFVGSGVVGLNLGFPENILADSNADLIAVYSFLQHDGGTFIETCTALFTPDNNCAATYYSLRNEFNATADTWRKACLFVYLNRHGYNGLCRYNHRGRFNVPFGRYTRPRLPPRRMAAFHAYLQRCVLRGADFRQVLEEAGAGDFVYCDPPYVPASTTANFTSYATHGFTPRDQNDLVACSRAAARRGACVALSNHDTPETRDLYAGADECHELLVPRRISCHAATRVHARELLAVFRPAPTTRDSPISSAA
jgi:DNA adenine methylase